MGYYFPLTEMTLKQSKDAVMSWIKSDDMLESDIYDNMTTYKRHNVGYNESYEEIQDFKESHKGYNQHSWNIQKNKNNY